MSDELPAVAAARMAELQSSGTWGSALTADEFAAIRSAGFEPVGQVFGAAVYTAGSVGFSCPGARASASEGLPPEPATQVSGEGDAGSFGPLVQAMYAARHAAIDRMTAECAELGGNGVVGVRLSRGSFPLGGTEFRAIGTAVRVPGPSPGPPEPFTSDLSGQDFAKLILAGWAPAGLVLGISIGARHDDWMTVSQTRWGSGNTEVHGYTELVNHTRHDARVQLERDVARHGADGVVLQDMSIRVGEHECPMQEGRRDHVVEAMIVGTAIAHFGRRRHPDLPPPLAIMSLDPQRRQAARVRLGG